MSESPREAVMRIAPVCMHVPPQEINDATPLGDFLHQIVGSAAAQLCLHLWIPRLNRETTIGEVIHGFEVSEKERTEGTPAFHPHWIHTYVRDQPKR